MSVGWPNVQGMTRDAPGSPPPTYGVLPALPSAVDEPPLRTGSRVAESRGASGAWAQVRWWVGTVIAVVLVGFIDLSWAVLPASAPMGGAENAWHVVGFLAGLGSGIAMFWRRSRPMAVLLYCAIGALITPMGPLGALGALTWLYVRAKPRTMLWATALVAAATAMAMWRDHRAGQYAFMTTGRGTGVIQVLPGWGYAILGVALVAIAVAVGFVRRYREAETVAQAAVRARERDVAVLRGELDRQEERELIAREMHDTVAHHLSLVSLHAAALEVSSQDPNVPEAAREMRSSAHRALEEMRSLIASLRDSSDGGYAGTSPRLGDLGRLIEDAQRAGARIYPDLEIPRAEPPAALTRGVYRIVQESLTNAIKHGQGSGVTLWVRAFPGHGIDIGVVSWMPRWGYPAPASERTGSGAGLVGMRERAEALGGQLSAGQEGDAWAVRVHLPWKGEG